MLRSSSLKVERWHGEVAWDWEGWIAVPTLGEVHNKWRDWGIDQTWIGLVEGRITIIAWLGLLLLHYVSFIFLYYLSIHS